MPKCDFNKIAKQLYWNLTLTWVFFYKFTAYFQNAFSQEHIWRAASEMYRTLPNVRLRSEYTYSVYIIEQNIKKETGTPFWNF